ncbi:Sec-independent protein translocase subunit TatA [Nonomuraea purpurea]|uniref:Sec-independent protein translocase protein TatA n=1 Tax=Nonomuraea purpurea TaxID=1849276 RepID=A0ABV8GCQ9_9ACTN
MPNLGVPELLIIALVLVLLFGAKKLPEMARGVGRSLRIFKSETAKLRDEDETTHTAQAQTPSSAYPQPAQPQPQVIQGTPVPSAEEQARQLEEQAARLRASAAAQADKRV